MSSRADTNINKKIDRQSKGLYKKKWAAFIDLYTHKQTELPLPGKPKKHYIIIVLIVMIFSDIFEPHWLKSPSL